MIKYVVVDDVVVDGIVDIFLSYCNSKRFFGTAATFKCQEDLHKLLNDNVVKVNGWDSTHAAYAELAVNYYSNDDELVASEMLPFSQMKSPHKTIMVNGFEVLDGDTDLQQHDQCYLPNFYSDDYVSDYWVEDVDNEKMLGLGILYRSKVSAVNRAKAMLGINPNV
jgi:hypothetical protein